MSVNSISTLLTANTLSAKNGAISFGFVGGPNEVSQSIKSNVRYIFDSLIEPFIKVRFVETQGEADINFQLHDWEEYYAYEQDHDIFFHRSYDNADTENGFQGGVGTHGFMSIIHETLHALGMKHPGNYVDGGVDYAPFLPYNLDNTTNSVMSYNFVGESAGMPMPYDIGALRHVYGKRSLNNGKTSYSFDSVYSFKDGSRSWGESDSPSKLTLLDDGGYDSVDFSQLATNAFGYTLDAREGGIFTTTEAFNSYSYKPRDRTNDNLPEELTSGLGTRVAFGTMIESIVGSTSKDLIVAGIKTASIDAGEGDDTVYGRDRKDIIFGGLGADQIFGENGQDILYGGTGDAAKAGQDSGDWLYGGDGRDKLFGEGGDDVLYGQAHSDRLSGGDGNDWLIGSDGSKDNERDFLTGGAGRDRFVLGTAEAGVFYQGNGRAVITDWEAGIDQIQLTLGSDQYTVEFRQMLGGAALDAGLYFKGDLIGVVQDSTEISLSGSDVIFV